MVLTFQFGKDTFHFPLRQVARPAISSDDLGFGTTAHTWPDRLLANLTRTADGIRTALHVDAPMERVRRHRNRSQRTKGSTTVFWQQDLSGV